MKTVKSKPLMRKIRQANPNWFSEENRRFFNDVAYMAYYGKTTGKAYLVRSTYAWTDMFGKKHLHYRINNLDQDTLKVGSLISHEFETIGEIKEWLETN